MPFSLRKVYPPNRISKLPTPYEASQQAYRPDRGPIGLDDAPRNYFRTIIEAQNNLAGNNMAAATLFNPITSVTEKAAEKAAKDAEVLINALTYSDSTGKRFPYLKQLQDAQDAINQGVPGEPPQPTRLSLRPASVSAKHVYDNFRDSDIEKSPHPLFEVIFDGGGSKGVMGVFFKLQLDSFLQLIPENEAEPDMWYSHIAVYDGVNEVHREVLTNDLVVTLAKNVLAKEPKTKVAYMNILQASGVKGGIVQMQKDLKDGGPMANGVPQRFLDWADRSEKFMHWIAPDCGIDFDKCREAVAEQRERWEKWEREERERRDKKPRGLEEDKPVSSRTRSKAVSDSDDSDKEQATRGTGLAIAPHKITRVIIPPSPDERLKRIKVIIGSKSANNSADMLGEFTALLDSLLIDKRIDKKMYKHILNQYI